MSAKIRVGNYIIETSAHGWNLSVSKMVDVRDKETKEPTGEKKESVQTIGFYSEIGQLTNRLIQGEMIQKDMETVREFIDCIDQFKSKLSESLK